MGDIHGCSGFRTLFLEHFSSWLKASPAGLLSECLLALSPDSHSQSTVFSVGNSSAKTPSRAGLSSGERERSRETVSSPQRESLNWNFVYGVFLLLFVLLTASVTVLVGSRTIMQQASSFFHSISCYK